MTLKLMAAIATTVIVSASTSSQTLAQQKTTKACQQEWRANRTANLANGVSEKSYVEQCRAGSAAQVAPAPAGMTTEIPPIPVIIGLRRRVRRALRRLSLRRWRSRRSPVIIGLRRRARRALRHLSLRRWKSRRFPAVRGQLRRVRHSRRVPRRPTLCRSQSRLCHPARQRAELRPRGKPRLEAQRRSPCAACTARLLSV